MALSIKIERGTVLMEYGLNPVHSQLEGKILDFSLMPGAHMDRMHCLGNVLNIAYAREVYK